MKKLLAIVVLGLLWSNYVYSETITLKCITTKKEVNGKENNIITGEPNKLDEKVQFIKINTKDKNAFQNELILGYVHFFKGMARSDNNSYITYETINRFDLTREEMIYRCSIKHINKPELPFNSGYVYKFGRLSGNLKDGYSSN